jgi:hypothetical protein
MIKLIVVVHNSANALKNVCSDKELQEEYGIY